MSRSYGYGNLMKLVGKDALLIVTDKKTRGGTTDAYIFVYTVNDDYVSGTYNEGGGQAKIPTRDILLAAEVVYEHEDILDGRG